MNKRILIIQFLILGIYFHSFSQTFKEQFNNLFEKKDTTAQHALLQKWEATDLNDPELYVSYYNYYVKKSMWEVVSIDRRPKSKDAFVVNDTGTNNTVGYINSSVEYRDGYLKLGFKWIDKGIEKFHNRLDMRFGKVYMLGKKEDYDEFTKEIVKTIDYSQSIKMKLVQ